VFWQNINIFYRRVPISICVTTGNVPYVGRGNATVTSPRIHTSAEKLLGDKSTTSVKKYSIYMGHNVTIGRG